MAGAQPKKSVTDNIQTNENTQDKKETQVEDKDLADLQPKATELTKKLLDMHAELAGVDNTQDITEQLLTLSQKKNKIEEQFHRLKVDHQSNVQQLTQLQNDLQIIERNTGMTAGKLDSSIATLDKWIDFWAVEEGNLSQWQAGLGQSSSLPTVQRILEKLTATINQAREDIDTHLLPLLAIQEKAGHMQISAYKLDLQVRALFKKRYQPGLYRHAPPLFSKEFTREFDTNLRHDTLHGIIQISQPDTKFLIQQRAVLTATAVLFLILLGSFSTGKNYLSGSSQWNFVPRRPVAVALFLSLLFFLAFSDKLPPFWLALFRALSLICVIRISRAIVSDRLQKRAITWLALLLLVTDLLIMISLPMPLMRLYMLSVALFFLTFFWLQGRHFKGSVSSPAWVIWSRRFAILFLIFILLAEVTGQAELAFFIFSAFLKTYYAGLFIWILYLILMVMVEFFLHYMPVPLIKNNAGQVAAMIRPIALVGCLLAFLIPSLAAWRIFPTRADALQYLSELGFSYGEVSISLGLVLAAGLLLYGSYCFSRISQAVLLQSVLPTQNLDKGIQLSITRLLHYGIMLIGFLMAMGAMGFSLTNLTILGGALGVGIGFGLQEIIKNFACGLILLFERPIKLGDTIQVGEDMAVVKELGLRATIVQTFDNAEIVLPNATLITGPVTNWTLKERRVRVKVPVGVAYGSDVEKVLEILLNCAEAHPLVLSTPKASALFMAFGASSLDFELRVFIPEFTDRRLVQSELNMAINSEFSDAGIEIPFPQNDLHLRSVEPAAAALLTGQ